MTLNFFLNLYILLSYILNMFKMHTNNKNGLVIFVIVEYLTKVKVIFKI